LGNALTSKISYTSKWCFIGIVIAILIFISPTQLGTSDYINYLKTILPSIISMLIGILSGALLAPLFE